MPVFPCFLPYPFLARVCCPGHYPSLSPPAAVTTASGSTSWGLGFQEEGTRPTGNASMEELAPYDAYYAKDTQEKKIYLTFDCGYENGNTPLILSALKKHNVKATFFVVGNFVKDNADLIKEMVNDGHTVGNHTLTHRICPESPPWKISKNSWKE